MISFAEPAHPGRVLKDNYLDPLNMSAGALAARIETSSILLSHLVKGDVAITAETALRLAHVFATTPEYWMNLQRDYDLHWARKRVSLRQIEPVSLS